MTTETPELPDMGSVGSWRNRLRALYEGCRIPVDRQECPLDVYTCRDCDRFHVGKSRWRKAQ